jgi:hypothetical protein
LLADLLLTNITVGTNLVKTTIRVCLSRCQSAPSYGANERILLKSPERLGAAALRSRDLAVHARHDARRIALPSREKSSPYAAIETRALRQACVRRLSIPTKPADRFKASGSHALAHGPSPRIRRSHVTTTVRQAHRRARRWRNSPAMPDRSTDDRDRSCIGQHGHNMCIVCQVRRPGPARCESRRPASDQVPTSFAQPGLAGART